MPRGPITRLKRSRFPIGARSLAGYFHLPENHTGEPLPCLVMVTGMDAFKEQTLGSSSDRFLRRGFACVVLDGPSSGYVVAARDLVRAGTLREVGNAAVNWLLQRKETDSKRIMAWGLSFGVFLGNADGRCGTEIRRMCRDVHLFPASQLAALRNGIPFVQTAFHVYDGGR